MINNRRPKIIGQILFLLTTFAFFVTVAGAGQLPSDQLKQKAVAKAEDRSALKNYRGKNGILSLKTILFGSMFRVTTVIPFKGDFGEYHNLEIAKPSSLVGRALKPQVASEQVARFKSQFESRRLFKSVTVIDSYDPTVDSRQQLQAQTNLDDVDKAESLDTPTGNFDDMLAHDQRRALREQEGEQPGVDKTLVVVIEVLDYAKGSRLKQSLRLDLGKSILTVRLYYYDKSTGEEIGRQIISGQSDGSGLFSLIDPQNGLSGVADGFVDQVTRRVAASEK